MQNSTFRYLHFFTNQPIRLYYFMVLLHFNGLFNKFICFNFFFFFLKLKVCILFYDHHKNIQNLNMNLLQNFY